MTTGKPAPVAAHDAGLPRFSALKAWRAEVAREHNPPTFMIFHDTTVSRRRRGRDRKPWTR